MAARRAAVGALVPVYLCAIVGVPFAAVAALVVSADAWPTRLAAFVVGPPLFGILYLAAAGALSRLTRRAIVAGRLPRDLGHPVYGPRRLYALCWTAVHYCTPIHHAMLAMPALKRLAFRLFGYRGSLAFQSYPDTWLRDLPLLTIGDGAYLSNKATISPNMCLADGTILILPVQIGARAMIGHLTMVAPGAEIADDAEVGVGASIGVKARIGPRSYVGHNAALDHQAVVGAGCEIGARGYVGRKAIVRDGVRVAPGVVVPARTVLATQAEADALAVRQGLERPCRGAGEHVVALASVGAEALVVD